MRVPLIFRKKTEGIPRYRNLDSLEEAFDGAQRIINSHIQNTTAIYDSSSGFERLDDFFESFEDTCKSMDRYWERAVEGHFAKKRNLYFGLTSGFRRLQAGKHRRKTYALLCDTVDRIMHEEPSYDQILKRIEEPIQDFSASRRDLVIRAAEQGYFNERSVPHRSGSIFTPMEQLMILGSGVIAVFGFYLIITEGVFTKDYIQNLQATNTPVVVTMTPLPSSTPDLNPGYLNTNIGVPVIPPTATINAPQRMPENPSPIPITSGVFQPPETPNHGFNRLSPVNTSVQLSMSYF